jgi:2-dehydro-3-deoxyphosphogluconate aldolase / (4S)-4-hydroxy-2-oxoglutarate aldolase
MARFTRIRVYNQLRETGILPIFYHSDFDTCMKVIKACYMGGTRVFEFTNRGDQAHETFKMIYNSCMKELPDLILGVGSIVDGPTSSLYIQLGANFIVSPVMVDEMARVCNRRKIAWIPGTGSATEISDAEMLGAEIIKIFPAESVGGPEFIKAVSGPMPWTHLMPTGGVKPEEENIKSWLSAGAFCLGMGSQLMVKTKDGKYDFAEIERLTTLSIQWARKYNKW